MHDIYGLKGDGRDTCMQLVDRKLIIECQLLKVSSERKRIKKEKEKSHSKGKIGRDYEILPYPMTAVSLLFLFIICSPPGDARRLLNYYQFTSSYELIVFALLNETHHTPNRLTSACTTSSSIYSWRTTWCNDPFPTSRSTWRTRPTIRLLSSATPCTTTTTAWKSRWWSKLIATKGDEEIKKDNQ